MDPIKTEIVVSGAGPGRYAAAFYAADLANKVILVEQDKRLGGVCLNRGCIPSKALLHATHMFAAAKESEHRGIAFGAPQIDLAKLRAWKESVLAKLSGGVAQLAKLRGVEVWNGRGHFEDSGTLRVETEQGQKFVDFEQAIIAVGWKSAIPKAFDLGNPRVMTSREALEVEDIPEHLLVVGGGYIGMELGTVYATLGSKVVLVEALETILTGADPDLVRPVMNYAKKATKEGRIAVEVITGEDSAFVDVTIPAVVFTDPEVAWCGLTEAAAKEKKIEVQVAKFPWAASGRALSFDRPDGLTKLIIEPETERILGVGIVGHGAGELISEGVLAVEMGATAKDLALAVHPHPTLSETLLEAAESYYGHATHIMARKKQ